MPYERRLQREAIQRVSRAGMPSGEVRETQAPIRREEARGPLDRQNLVFDDITGVSLIGFGTMETMTT